MIHEGDIVQWESQSQGFWRTKKGRVLAIVPARQRIEDVWPEAMEIIQARRKWSNSISIYDRVIVEVTRKSGRGVDYYAPRLKWLTFKEVEER